MSVTTKSKTARARAQSPAQANGRRGAKRAASAQAQTEPWRVQAATLIDPTRAMDSRLEEADWEEIRSATDTYSKAYDIPPDLIYGMMYMESNFGIGFSGGNVMQVLQAGKNDIVNCGGFDSADVSTRRKSIEAACAYLHVLLARSQKNRAGVGEPRDQQANLVEAVRLYNNEALGGKSRGEAYCGLVAEKMGLNGAGTRNKDLIEHLKALSPHLVKNDFFDKGFKAALDEPETKYVIKRDKVLKPLRFTIDNSNNSYPIKGYRVRAQMFGLGKKPEPAVSLPVIAGGEVYNGVLENLDVSGIKAPDTLEMIVYLTNKKCPLHPERKVTFKLTFLAQPTGPFIYNKNTNEVHDLGNETPSCNIAKITNEHREDLKEFPKKELESGKKDGCRWCLPQYHRE